MLEWMPGSAFGSRSDIIGLAPLSTRVRRKPMAYFPDLNPYSYGHGLHPGVLHVGWLDGVHDYPKGKVAQHILAKLKRLAAEPTELYRGFHVCELCSLPEDLIARGNPGYWDWAKPRSSNGEIRVTSGDATYAAPVLIVHYIEEHGYLPPEEFLRAVMEGRREVCPSPLPHQRNGGPEQ